MMKLSLMETFFTTVDDEWSSPVADEIASRWFSKPDSVKIMRASANFVSLITADQEHYTLRFNSEELRPIEALQSEIRLLLSLRNFDLPVQKPVKSLDGNFSELISTDLGRFTAVVFDFIPGEIKDPDTLSPEGFRIWGENLGKLHRTLSENQFTQSIHHPRLLEQLKSAQPPTAQGSKEQGALLEWISTLERTRENYGVIHYDFELDNLIWDENGKVHIIDFDDSALSWYLADLAFALRDLWDAVPDLQDPRLTRFLSGYRAYKKLDPSVLAHLNGFLRLHDFLTYHRLLKAVDLEISSSHPQWLQQLYTKLNGTIQELEGRFSSYPDRVTPLDLP